MNLLRHPEFGEKRLKRYSRWITLNGWLLPAKRRMVVEKFQPHMQYSSRRAPS